MPTDLDSHIEAWRAQLLDTTKRNRLISFKSGRTGGVRFLHPDPGTLWSRLLTSNSPLHFAWKRELLDLPPDADAEPGANLSLFDPEEQPAKRADEAGELQDFLDSPRLRPHHVIADLPDRQLATRLNRLALNARESLAEQGVATLFAAFGFLRWYESKDSKVEILSPLLLMPVRLERNSVDAPWKLAAEDDEILPNYSLAQLLRSDFRVEFPIPDTDPAEVDDSNWRVRYFGEVARAIRDQPTWGVVDEVALGTFSFQKLAMWEDLGRNRARVAAHALCRAVAGDRTALHDHPSDLPAARELDQKTHPKDTFHILDADSSQHEAIAATVRGASLVLDGPPGTGKSQTIANIIAEFLAAGKTVLFVSEKAAALEVVQRRLQAKRLDDFVLACHSHKANKREVVNELGRCLSLPPEVLDNSGDELNRLFETRRQLNEYVRELHVKRAPLGKTAFEVHGELARTAAKVPSSRCPIPHVMQRDDVYLRHVTELLARLPDCRRVVENHQRHPWRGCRATVFSQTLRDDTRHHFDRLANALGTLRNVAVALHGLGLAAADPNWSQLQTTLAACRNILACPLVPSSWFASDARIVAECCVQLDRLATEFRRDLTGLSEFRPDALRQGDAAALARALSSEPDPRLIPRTGESLRSLCERAAALAERLRELHERTRAVVHAHQQVVNLLQIPATTPMKALGRLAALAGQLARTRLIRKPWWDSARRAELSKVMTRCREESRSAQEIRVALADRFAPVALMSESAALAAKAAWYGSFLRRLLPGWWSLKSEIATWYIEQPPAAQEIQRDLAMLVNYHRSNTYCQQVRQRYSADVFTDADGNADWDTTVEALRSVDHLEEFGKIPAGVQQALSESGNLDRASLDAAARLLEQHWTALRKQINEVVSDYDLRDVVNADNRVCVTAPELMSWLEKQVPVVSRRASLWQQLAGLLVPEQDIPVSALPARLKAVCELAAVQAQIASICPRIWPSGPPTGVEDRDWSTLRTRAECLLALLKQWKTPLPPAVVKVLTVPEARDRLTGAIAEHDAASDAGFAESWCFLQGLFDSSASVSVGITIDQAALSAIQRWLADRSADADRLYEWTVFREIERDTAQAGVAASLMEVLDGAVQPEVAADAFRVRFLRLWLDALYEQVPALRQFRTDGHERLIERFRDLDRRSVASAISRIRAGQLARHDRPRIGVGDAPTSSELGTLLHEVNKKRRHLPLRRLFAALPTLLSRLKPCIMMSPLAVSTYLNLPDLEFDLVIFDEASQVRPHDAICAMYRGRQLVVAGDQKQLPPTSFFERAVADTGDESDDTDEDGQGLVDFDSVLDVCCTLGLPRRRLRWHYRSRREGLIAFANRHVYANELVTFPSVHDVVGNAAITFDFVQQGRWKPGATGGFNAVEARRTAELVLEHFRHQPKQSLGVIAFSQRQQLRILDELERLRQAHPELEDHFEEQGHEPFFVKNLENVQGDERDVIIIGVGYGPDETGRVAMRFGPLNQQGGERRLNVAVTRARQRMLVVSSMRCHDIDLSRTSAAGVKLLRAFLDYAERGVQALHGMVTGARARDFDSPFEREVYEELTRRGLVVHTQVGCSGFRVDQAIVDPKEPGRYLLGIECDGATYHSSATARDRDRLRQEVLEGLDWRICRIWSTDWLRDRETQVQRVLAALAEARKTKRPQESVTPPPTQSARNDTPSAATPAKPDVTASYDAIADVPKQVLKDTIIQTLREFGATGADEVVQAVARRLGFKRTGSVIQATIGECIKWLIDNGSISGASDGRLQATPTRNRAVNS